MEAQSPTVEHAEEADFGAEVSRGASDFQQRFRAGMEEQVVDEPLVLQCERGQFTGQSEDGVDVAGRQQFPFARLEPASARVALATWAMPVSARVIRDGSRMSAACTAVTMSAQGGGAAARDSQQHFLVLPVDPPVTAFYEGLSSTANNVGHLQERPAHQRCLSPPCEEKVSASSGLAVALRCCCDKCR